MKRMFVGGMAAILAVAGLGAPLSAQAIAANSAHLDFFTSYNYAATGDVVPAGTLAVTGKNAAIMITNTMDGTGQPLVAPRFDFVPAPGVTVTGGVPAPLPSGPPYAWTPGDIADNTSYQQIALVSPGATDFTPGFSGGRTISPTFFSGPGTQTVTISGIATAPTPELRFIVTVPPADQFVAATIIMPTPTPGYNYLPGPNRLEIWITNPTVNTVYSQVVEVGVVLKPGVTTSDFKASVSIARLESIASGSPSAGTTVTSGLMELGTWTCTTPGEYMWGWNSYVRKTVIFPAITRNSVGVYFNEYNNYNTPGDIFTDQIVTYQPRSWNSWSSNWPDPPTNPAVTDLRSTLVSAIPLSWMSPPPVGVTPPVNPGTYEWTFGSLGNGASTSSAPALGNGTAMAPANPGFNVSRFITPSSTLTTPVTTQTLTISVTPLVPMDQLNINVNASENSLVHPQIKSPTTTSGTAGGITTNVNLSADNHSLNISIFPITPDMVGNAIAKVVTLEVALRPGVTSAVYMPQVSASNQDNVLETWTWSSAVATPITELGTWSWSSGAGGPYAWYARSAILKTVNLLSTQYNNVWTGFNTNYGYGLPGDSFTNVPVTGNKGWSTWLNNSSDGTGLPVVSANVTLSSPLPSFDYMNPNTWTSPAPQTYLWNFGNVGQNLGVGPNVGLSTVEFTPGFDVNRLITPLIVTSSGTTQTLTLYVTPREDMDQLNINVNVGPDGLVNPTITSPPTGPGTNLSPDGRSLGIYITKPTPNDTITRTITINVNLEAGVTSADYMPAVSISNQKNTDSGWVTGSSLPSDAVTDLGQWVWSATGNYAWNWWKLFYKNVNLWSTQRNNVWVSFNRSYVAGVPGDTFTNTEVTGNRSWFANIHNSQDNTNLPVDDPTLTVNTNQQMAATVAVSSPPLGPPRPWSSSSGSGPYQYQLSLADLPQGTGNGVGFQSAAMDPVVFTPGFDASRTISPLTLGASGDQTILVTVTPLEAMGWLTVNLNTWQDGRVNPTVASATSVPPVQAFVSPERTGVSASISNPTIGQPFIVTVIIHTELLGAAPVDYMPWVNVNAQSNLGNGVTAGSQVSVDDADLGKPWAWSATGVYAWTWWSYLQRNIAMGGYSWIPPMVTTSAATAVGTSSATLNMSFDFKDYGSGQVQFKYKKTTDSAWTYSDWIAGVGSGTSSQVVNSLSPNTGYQFAARLKYGTTEIEGPVLTFTSLSDARKSTKTFLGSYPNPSESGKPVALIAAVLVMAPGSAPTVTFGNGEAKINPAGPSAQGFANPLPVPTGTVAFKEGGIIIGTATLNKLGIATFTSSSLSFGKHSLTAEYSGDPGNSSSISSVVTQSVKYGSSTKVTSSANPSLLGQALAFTATVTGQGVTPTGMVTFKDGFRTLGSVKLTGNTATLNANALPGGSHDINAVYEGDDTYMGSDGHLTQIVNKANSKISLASTPNPSNRGQRVTLTATVGPVTPGSGLPTGKVIFKDGGTTLGTDTLNSAGKASYSTSSLSRGSHTITVVYVGDDSFNGSTSAIVNQKVN
jgi:hypothetical protein